jgi:ligand-binding SRPBCC domain-containing protein
MPILKTDLWLPASLEDIWDFHKDPRNLLKITPAMLKVKIDLLPEQIVKGSELLIHSESKILKPFLKWTVLYEDWKEDEDYKMFKDSQSQGPFKSWHHTHEFIRGTRELIVGEKIVKSKLPGTWVKDTVEYELKKQFKPFSFVAEKLLTKLFVFRKRTLLKLFNTKEELEVP